jgi:hypothetical protein
MEAVATKWVVQLHPTADKQKTNNEKGKISFLHKTNTHTNHIQIYMNRTQRTVL